MVKSSGAAIQRGEGAGVFNVEVHFKFIKIVQNKMDSFFKDVQREGVECIF